MINTKKIGSVLKNINNIDELSISDVIDCNQYFQANGKNVFLLFHFLFHYQDNLRKQLHMDIR